MPARDDEIGPKEWVSRSTATQQPLFLRYIRGTIAVLIDSLRTRRFLATHGQMRKRQERANEHEQILLVISEVLPEQLHAHLRNGEQDQDCQTQPRHSTQQWIFRPVQIGKTHLLTPLTIP